MSPDPRAPYLGLDRDVIMGGRQRLELPTGNSDVLLGREFAMIEAGQMQGHAAQSHIRESRSNTGPQKRSNNLTVAE